MKLKSRLFPQNSLSGFIKWSYIRFTILNFLFLFFVYTFAGIVMNQIAFTPDINGLLKQVEKMRDKEFMYFSGERYVGKSGNLVILDENGRTIYSGDIRKYGDYMKEELAYIPDYQSEKIIHVVKLPQESPDGKFMLQEEYTDDKGMKSISGYQFLDESLAVLSGTLFQEKKFFTEKELRYLAGVDEEGRMLRKYNYINPNGEKRTLLFMLNPVSLQKYEQAYKVFRFSRWLVIPVYTIVLFICVWTLNRKMKQLFAPLNEAVLRLASGKLSNLQEYKGPDEFQKIADNFCVLEERLLKSEWEKKRMDTQRQHLLADISHDLKTPLTVIQGYASALRDGMVPREQQKMFLNTIVENSKKMDDLVSMFHDYSKLEHPDMPREFKCMNICALTELYFAQRYQEIELEGFLMEVVILQTPMYCMVDEKLFVRIMENLINNAMRYNPQGTCIYVSLYSEDESAVITISDNGVGIPENLRESLFDPFVIGDDSRGKKHGSGLGLAITKKIVELHGGTISLADDEKYATSFKIKFPVKR